jgi:hypothetical protein
MAAHPAARFRSLTSGREPLGVQQLADGRFSVVAGEEKHVLSVCAALVTKFADLMRPKSDRNRVARFRA